MPARRAIFSLHFLVELIVAPHKTTYLRQHWLTALSLLLPAFSMLRVLQALQLVRVAAMSGSFSLLGIITACNRGMVATRRLLGRHKLGYVATLTLLITLAGAAGMYSFENPAALRAHGYGSAVQGGAGLHNYAEAVWWTAMVMTTMGSAASLPCYHMSMDTSYGHQDSPIPAGEFKQHCLALLDQVAETGMPIVVTKRGRPVARVVPIESPSAFLSGSLHVLTENEEELYSTGATWDAEQT